MKSFKTYFTEAKKSNWLLGAALAGSASLFATGLAKHYGVFNNTKENEQVMSATDVDAMMKDMFGNVHGINNSTTPTEQPKTKSEVQDKPKYYHEAIKNMVIQDEGLRTKPYRDTKGILTVGIGHNLETPDSIRTFKKAFGENGQALHYHASKGGSLSQDQAKKLFDVDYEHHLQKAVKLTPNLHEHSPEVQSVIVSATYRGHWGGSPAARKLFNQGKYKEAAKELLNNKEFERENAKTKNRGVADRMIRDSKILHNYSPNIETNKKN